LGFVKIIDEAERGILSLNMVDPFGDIGPRRRLDKTMIGWL
jgi:hypothetical protein